MKTREHQRLIWEPSPYFITIEINNYRNEFSFVKPTLNIFWILIRLNFNKSREGYWGKPVSKKSSSMGHCQIFTKTFTCY